jgi:hypothetical protein
MKIRDIIERNRVMPHTAKPMGLIHKKGYGPNNRYGFKNHSNNRVNEAVQFTKPNAQYEWSEAQRYSYIKKLGLVGWNKLVNTGQQVNVSQFGGIRKINNTTALNQPMAARELPKLEPDKVQRAQQSLKMGKFELPIVMKTPQDTLELVAGNTRFTIMVAKGMTPTVWYIDASGLQENFADGKVKGKSRPGRVKRAGASCAGSVSSLRAKAKKYGGEKAKMYHWCANMKSGKSKGK